MFLFLIHKKYPEIYILLENGNFDIILDVFLAIASKSAQKWDFNRLYEAANFFEKQHFLDPIKPCLHPLDATLVAPSLNEALSLPKEKANKVIGNEFAFVLLITQVVHQRHLRVATNQPNVKVCFELCPHKSK